MADGDRTTFAGELPEPVAGVVTPAEQAPELVPVELPSGGRGYVSPEELPEYVARGARVIGQEEQDQIILERQLEKEYGDRPIAAGLLGGARGATLGLSDVVASEVFGEGEAVREIRGRHPGISLATEIVGGIGPALIPGAGAFGAVARLTPAGQVARIGTGVLARGAGRGAVARIGYGAAAGTAEGALFGAGAGVSELALSDEHVTAERAVSVLGSHTLYGAAVGGVVGGGLPLLGAAAGKGLRKAKQLTDDLGQRLASGKPGRDAVVEQVGAYRQSLDESNAFLAAEGESRKVLTKTSGRLRHLADEPIGLAENPRGLLDPLRRQKAALQEMADESPALVGELAVEEAARRTKFGRQLDNLAPDAESITLKGVTKTRYADYTGTRAVRNKPLEVPVAEARAFRAAWEAGDVQGARMVAHGKIPGLIAQNDALLAAVQASVTKAEQTLAAKVGSGLAQRGQDAVLGMVAGGPIGGLIGLVARPVLAKIKTSVLDRIARAGAESSARASAALDGLLAVGKRVGRVSPPVAVLSLQRVSYAPEAAAARATYDAGASPLLSAYRVREREIVGQVDPTPAGARMKRSAREQVAERLRPIALASPILADRMEAVAARRLEYLADRLPRRPGYMALQLGPDRWRPSDMEMSSFGRTVAAVEDPIGVLERLADTTITPEDADAMRAVYPELYNETRAEIVRRTGELRETLPYDRRLALSIFYGVPVDPSMEPQILAVLQAQYVNEEGTEGGTEPPMAQPQFAAVSREQPTDAQQRSS